MSDPNPLVQFIRSKIQQDGPVSFAWFMEQALYHPAYGYYSSGKAKLGRKGDYFTNVSVGSTFGRLMAGQFVEIWQRLGKPDPFTIIEQGAHHGELARDVLAALTVISPEFFNRVHYLIVEPFPALRDRQKQSLADFAERVTWRGTLEAVEAFVGVHFSNELLDAFPVHLVRRQRESVDTDPAVGEAVSFPRSLTGSPTENWFEKCVDWKGDKFTFVQQPITDSSLRQQLENMVTPPGHFEFNQAALDWIDLLSTKLQRGYVLIIDYGYLQEDLAQPGHRRGTLQCRANHQIVDSPLERVGECDITSHVDWTSIATRARRQTFEIAGFTDQHHFLTGIISEHPALATDGDPGSRRQLQTLLHPEMMGRSFQVLALGRDIDPAVRLSGFKFARPGDV
jgi:SAM-dependent MidA family methyltransferase